MLVCYFQALFHHHSVRKSVLLYLNNVCDVTLIIQGSKGVHNL